MAVSGLVNGEVFIWLLLELWTYLRLQFSLLLSTFLRSCIETDWGSVKTPHG